MPLTLPAMNKAACSTMHDHVSIEYWGIAGEEGALYRGGVNGSFSESDSDPLSSGSNTWLSISREQHIQGHASCQSAVRPFVHSVV